jgi:hypothetical protein
MRDTSDPRAGRAFSIAKPKIDVRVSKTDDRPLWKSPSQEGHDDLIACSYCCRSWTNWSRSASLTSDTAQEDIPVMMQ